MTPMGEIAIRTDSKKRFLTAVGGGGKTTDVIHTDAVQPRAWEKFKLWVDQTKQYCALQTVNGHFLTATNGGGLIYNTVLSNATSIGGWEIFKIVPQPTTSNSFYERPFAIQTANSNFLTAVGGGGHSTGTPIHTDATAVAEWEKFNLLKSGDLGSGSTYTIMKAGPYGGGEGGPWIVAIGGGRQSEYALSLYFDPITSDYDWTLIKQDDGSYAFQTISSDYLTAIAGGEVGLTTKQGFRTDATTIGNFEKFTLIDNGDFTYYIKTYLGYYLSIGLDVANSSQYMDTVIDINKATKWQFWVFKM